MTGYEQTTVGEIRDKLRSLGVTDEEFLKNSKTILVNKLLTMDNNTMDTSNDEQEVPPLPSFDDAEEVPDDALLPFTKSDDVMPAYASEAWHDYVMRQFREDELMDGAPTCDGCRRVVEAVLGPIVATQIFHITPPSTLNNGTATIGVKVDVAVNNEGHPLNGNVVTVEEVADVNRDNCDPPYHKYASATAASRAEGRALRKLLRLRNVHVAEEVSEQAEQPENDIDWVVDEPITDSQINVIDMLCRRMDIDVMGFVNSGRSFYKDVNEVKKSVAQRMIMELNKLQRQVKDKPVGVEKYNSQWRAKDE